MKQFEHYKKYEIKEGGIIMCRFFAEDDKDAQLYRNKVMYQQLLQLTLRSKSVRNN